MGVKIQQTRYSAENIPESISVNEYDDEGRVTNTIAKDQDRNLMETVGRTYDENGNWISEATMDAEGNCEFLSEFEYISVK